MDTEAAREQALAAAREQALDAAEELFYARGIQTVGMDDIRGASGVSSSGSTSCSRRRNYWSRRI